MNLNLAQEIAKARKEIADQFRPMFEAEFAGLAPGTTYLKDDEFMRWYESEIQGIPLPVDELTGQPVMDELGMQAWKKPPRPNFEQLLALSGEDGKEILYRYSKLTGRHEQMKAFVQVVNMMAKQQQKKAG